MGTSGLLLIKKDGKYVLSHYNHWDSYPSGRGSDIVEFFKNLEDWESFKKNLQNVKMISKNEDKPDKYYRSECISTLEDVECGESIIIHNEFDFIYDTACEWAYVVDFDTNTFEIYKGMGTDYVTPPSNRFYTTTKKNENNPRLLKKYSLDELPEGDDFDDLDFETDFEEIPEEIPEESEKRKKIKLSENDDNTVDEKENNENSDKTEWLKVFQCSNCERISKTKENYCPSCGKKMMNN